MAELVGGAFLSGFANVLLDRLSSPEFVNLIRGKKLGDQLLQRLETTLYAVRAVLNDAEQKHIKEQEVKDWLDGLKDALYVADDLLDEVSTKAATQKKVTNFFSGYFNSQEKEMVNKLEDIADRLERILKLKDALRLEKIETENFSWRVLSPSLEDGSKIYGRDKDKEAIIKLLLEDDDSKSDDKISVIPILGMGGIGKTTLAQSVYKDEILKHQFDFKRWICVSQEFDIRNAPKMDSLHRDLKDQLTGKKFLVVLDDVWIEQYGNWNLLKSFFQYGAKGSKIVITTRNENVASLVGTVPAYHLNHLSDEDCWLVFAKHARLSLQPNENKALKHIGKKIIKKCKGLPLAAQSLGGMLQSKCDIKDWNNVLNNNIWEFSGKKTEIIPALEISYHYLPPHLKGCFVYCSLYPKNYEFDKEELILFWMAEDLIHPQDSGKTLEDVGYEYFDYLTSISFIQHSSTRSKYFVMHDLIHDLATFLGEKFYFRLEKLEKVTNINAKTRHLSFCKYSDPIAESFSKANSLRTFLPIKLEYASFDDKKAPDVILSKFKCLRTLSFCGFENLDALPDSIGKLVHLRYLDLSYTLIKTLPESLSFLYNLQTLKLTGCKYLTILPSCMQRLINLRHLCIVGTRISKMPSGMGKLEHLQHLSMFIVGKNEEDGIEQLGKLSNLHGSLLIDKLENVTNDSEALEARMMDKKHIECLTLKWDSDVVEDSQMETDILWNLQPHQYLKELELIGYRSTRFPYWVGDYSYKDMTKLSIMDCKYCYMLPSLGQLPSLKHLEIKRIKSLMVIGVEFYKSDESSTGTPFPSLEFLEFNKMPDLENWHSFESDAFPKLKHLSLIDCPKLTGSLPNDLPALEKLSIERCLSLVSSLRMAPAIHTLQIYESDIQGLEELPPSVELLEINGDMMIAALVDILPTHLQSLSMSNCKSAIWFPGVSSPAPLKILYISNCGGLEFSMPHQLISLVSLTVYNSFHSLTSFPLEIFPILNHLEIINCENLVYFSVSQSKDVRLRFLKVSRCRRLKSLPPQMNTLLQNLEHLVIDDCPEVKSYPQGGMPLNLRLLHIINCQKLLSGLVSMNMLTDLLIGGPLENVRSFPMEGLLPPSLTSLQLRDLSCLETLECEGLFHLTSLKRLTVQNCPKLNNIAGRRLPASLSNLVINGSPLLEERCRKKDPKIWIKVCNIEELIVKDRRIS